MPYNQTWPVGTTSVAGNQVKGEENTLYVQTTLQKDHYFNEGATDGLHKQIRATTLSAAPTIPGTPASDAAIYPLIKSNTESPDNEDVQWFMSNLAGTGSAVVGVQQFMQLLGIRACGVFSVSGTTITMEYSHGLSVASPVTFTTETATGKFTATFANTLPSANYLVLGDIVRNSSTAAFSGQFVMEAAETLSTVKSTSSFRFRTVTFADPPVLTNPLQCWFVVFGG